MKHISLFSGIGGFDLASEWAGWENVASVEIGDFPNKILEYHFPNALHYRDITKLNYDTVNEEISKRFGSNWRSNGLVLSGGFPCQGFSVAGLRAGTEDDRYLWPQFERAIDGLNPDWVVGENVTGILSMEDKSGIYRDVFAKVDHRKITRFPEIDYYEAVYTRQAKLLVGSICESLEERGYEVQTFAIPAAGVGAPHKRERIWFIAHRGRIAGDRGQSEQFGNSVNNGEDGKREEAADQFERSHKAGIDTNGSNAGPENLQPGGQDGVYESESTSNTKRNGSSGCGYGETGQAPAEGEGQGKKRKWVRAKSERNGGERTVADAKKHGRSEPSIGSSYGSGSRDKSQREDSIADEHANSPRCGQQHVTKITTESRFSCGRHIEDWSNWPVESPICSGNDGVSERLDSITFSKWRNESIKGAGNALVPQIPFEFFKIIDTISKM